MGDVEEPGSGDENTPLLGPQDVENTAVYPVIHAIRQDVTVSATSPSHVTRAHALPDKRFIGT